MPVDNAPLVPPGNSQDKSKEVHCGKMTCKEKALKSFGVGCGGCCCIIFFAVWIVQAFMYWFATLGCSVRTVSGYDFPAAESSDFDGVHYPRSHNLLPESYYISDRASQWFGSGMDVSQIGNVGVGATIGVFWQTWGPIFSSYTYEDVANSKQTMYMRRNLLRIGQSHRIGRCDGKGKIITLAEGGNFITNRFRHAFGMNQGYTYKIWYGDELVAVAEETHGRPSILFRNITSGDEIGSSVLVSRHTGDGLKYDRWLVELPGGGKPAGSWLPYYAEGATTLLYAFAIRGDKAEKATAKQEDVPHLLAAMGPAEKPAEEAVLPAQKIAVEPAAVVQAEAKSVDEISPVDDRHV